MTFQRYLLRLLWHWSFPLVVGVVLGFVAGAAQLFAMADVLGDSFASAVHACAAQFDETQPGSRPNSIPVR